jgi:hypothetical protein
MTEQEILSICSLFLRSPLNLKGPSGQIRLAREWYHQTALVRIYFTKDFNFNFDLGALSEVQMFSSD